MIFPTTKIRDVRRRVSTSIPIHEADAVLFLDQLLDEMLRLDWSVAWHLDNVSAATRERISDFPLTIGYSQHTGGHGRFVETHRQSAATMAQASGCEWWVPSDCDETWEPDAPAMLAELMQERIVWKVRWLNVWGRDTDGTPLIRIDQHQSHPLQTPSRWAVEVGIPLPANAFSIPGWRQGLRRAAIERKASALGIRDARTSSAALRLLVETAGKQDLGTCDRQFNPRTGAIQ